MAIFCLLNFVSFVPYSPNYLFFPFLGWMLQEGYRASGSWRYFVLGGTFTALVFLIGDWAIEWAIFELLGKKAAHVYNFVVLEGGCIVLLPIFVYAVVLRSLLKTPMIAEPSSPVETRRMDP